MAVLLSIQPRHNENICTVVGEKDGKPIYKKRIEVRKKRPKQETPFKCYIYCTQGKYSPQNCGASSLHDCYVMEGKGVVNGKVIGEFVCDKIEKIDLREMEDTAQIQREACLTRRELFVYLKEEIGYLWHISDLKIYDKPKELGEFKKAIDCEEGEHCFGCTNGFLIGNGGCRLKAFTRPPQSWCYVKEL